MTNAMDLLAKHVARELTKEWILLISKKQQMQINASDRQTNHRSKSPQNANKGRRH